MPDALKKTEGSVARPPIVVVMGHIDHGKTKILDWYRKTNVVDSESGGITQHINAYQATYHDRAITFIDTPGHEAFAKMRSRGADVADIAILVIAADEGVKPQTKEAIRIIQETELPFVVAFNKIDKPEANPERVKQELAGEGILVESYGGKVPSVEISAKAGTNMDNLLEVILLLADLEDLTADPRQPAEGVVIESHRDPRRGTTSTLLVRNGTLARGHILAIGKSVETIKILEDFQGRSAASAGPSSPAIVAGLIETPSVGDTFHSFSDKRSAKEFTIALPRESKRAAPHAHAASEAPNTVIFNIILKADVTGSREVLEDTIKKIESDTIKLNILRSDVGNINESDVKLAMATRLVTIVGFRVGIDAAVKELTRHTNVHVITNDVIYDLVDGVKHAVEEMLPPEVNRISVGKARILKVFKDEGKKQIIGGRCEQGVVKRGAKFEIERMKAVIGKGTIHQLQRDKRDVEEVGSGTEFGILTESDKPIQQNDIVTIFEEQITKRTL